MQISKIKCIMIKRIDNSGFPSYGLLGNFYPVISMHMAMDKVFGAIFIQQFYKALKSAVGEGIEVVDVPGWSMGKEDIKAFIPQ